MKNKIVNVSLIFVVPFLTIAFFADCTYAGPAGWIGLGAGGGLGNSGNSGGGGQSSGCVNSRLKPECQGYSWVYYEYVGGNKLLGLDYKFPYARSENFRDGNKNPFSTIYTSGDISGACTRIGGFWHLGPNVLSTNALYAKDQLKGAYEYVQSFGKSTSSTGVVDLGSIEGGTDVLWNYGPALDGDLKPGSQYRMSSSSSKKLAHSDTVEYGDIKGTWRWSKMFYRGDYNGTSLGNPAPLNQGLYYRVKKGGSSVLSGTTKTEGEIFSLSNATEFTHQNDRNATNKRTFKNVKVYAAKKFATPVSGIFSNESLSKIDVDGAVIIDARNNSLAEYIEGGKYQKVLGGSSKYNKVVELEHCSADSQSCRERNNARIRSYYQNHTPVNDIYAAYIIAYYYDTGAEYPYDDLDSESYAFCYSDDMVDGFEVAKYTGSITEATVDDGEKSKITFSDSTMRYTTQSSSFKIRFRGGVTRLNDSSVGYQVTTNYTVKDNRGTSKSFAWDNSVNGDSNTNNGSYSAEISILPGQTITICGSVDYDSVIEGSNVQRATSPEKCVSVYREELSCDSSMGNDLKFGSENGMNYAMLDTWIGDMSDAGRNTSGLKTDGDASFEYFARPGTEIKFRTQYCAGAEIAAESHGDSASMRFSDRWNEPITIATDAWAARYGVNSNLVRNARTSKSEETGNREDAWSDTRDNNTDIFGGSSYYMTKTLTNGLNPSAVRPGRTYTYSDSWKPMKYENGVGNPTINGTPVASVTSNVHVPYNYNLTSDPSPISPDGHRTPGTTITPTFSVTVHDRVNEPVDPSTPYSTATKPTKVRVYYKLIAENNTYNEANRGGTSNRAVDCNGAIGGSTVGGNCGYIERDFPDGFNGSTSNINAGEITIPELAPVGTKFCVATGFYPADSHNTGDGSTITSRNQDVALRDEAGDGAYWYISEPSCVTISKKPNFRAVSAGIYGSKTIRTSTTVRNIYDSGSPEERHFGSWSQFDIVAGEDVIGLASGRALYHGLNYSGSMIDPTIGGQNEARICYISTLSFTNYRCTGSASNHVGDFSLQLGISGSPDTLSNRIVSMFGKSAGSLSNALSVDYPTDPAGLGIVIASSRDTIETHNVTGSDFYNGFYANGSRHTSGVGAYVIQSAGTVVIDTDLINESTSNNFSQLFIIADKVEIRSNVTRVDAWIIAKEVATCVSNTTLGSPVTVDGVSYQYYDGCDNTLTINGAVTTRRINLGRFGGSEGRTSSEASRSSEVFNSTSDIVAWLSRYSDLVSGSSVAITTYVIELPPRY